MAKCSGFLGKSGLSEMRNVNISNSKNPNTKENTSAFKEEDDDEAVLSNNQLLNERIERLQLLGKEVSRK